MESVSELIFPKRDGKGNIAFLTENKSVVVKDKMAYNSPDPIDQYIPVLRAEGWPDYKIQIELDRLKAERQELLKQAGLA